MTIAPHNPQMGAGTSRGASASLGAYRLAPGDGPQGLQRFGVVDTYTPPLNWPGFGVRSFFTQFSLRGLSLLPSAGRPAAILPMRSVATLKFSRARPAYCAAGREQFVSFNASHQVPAKIADARHFVRSLIFNHVGLVLPKRQSSLKEFVDVRTPLAGA